MYFVTCLKSFCILAALVINSYKDMERLADEMLAIAFNENFNICEFDGVEVKDASIILHFNTIATSVYKDQNNVVYEDQGKDGNYHTFTLNGDTYSHVTVSGYGNNTNTYAKDGDATNGVKLIEGYLASAYHPYMIHPNYGSMDPKRRAITGDYRTEEQIDANTELCSNSELNTVSQAVYQTASYSGTTGNFYFIGNVEDPNEEVAADATGQMGVSRWLPPLQCRQAADKRRRLRQVAVGISPFSPLLDIPYGGIV